MPIRIEKNYPIFTIIIDCPEKRNAVDGPSAKELADAFRDFERDNNALVAILWGEGGNFCAGADLMAISKGVESENRINRKGDGPMGPSRMLLSKPTIAAVSGYAVAGGLELALWCDLRVMEKSAIFGVFCRRFGVPLIDGGTVRLPRLIGLSRALDMILTGRPITAQEAFEWGLANRLVEDGKSKSEAEKIANEIAVFPQTCMKNDRFSAYEQFGFDIKQALSNEFEYGMKTLASGEYLTGSKEFSQGKGKHGKYT